MIFEREVIFGCKIEIEGGYKILMNNWMLLSLAMR